MLPLTMAGKELQVVVEGNSIFTKQLYRVLSRDYGNMVFSSISAHAVLTMAYQGANGSTKQALAFALGLPDTNQAAQGYNAVMGKLNNIADVQLLIANKIYLMEGFNLNSTFKEVVEKKFLSEVEAVNFANSQESAAKINYWVESKTQNKIKDIISPDILDDCTRLLLVNAIYFKGNWAFKFDKSRTQTEKFYLNDNDFVDVQMMNKDRKYYYKEDTNLDAKVLELPYANYDFSLIVILPNKRNGIGELETKLASVDLSEIMNGMSEREVQVKLPRFKIETTINLEKPLVEIGLDVIFDKKRANFSGILENGGVLYVRDVIQKAFIEVNEEGTEAAAATALGMMMLCNRRPPPPVQFYADHGFVFLLSYKRQLFLFSGRLTYPKY